MRCRGEQRASALLLSLSHTHRTRARLPPRQTSSSGINFDQYDAIPVKTSGKGLIAPHVDTWHGADLGRLLLRNIDLNGCA